MKPPRWHHHPGVRTGDELTLGERAADAARNGMGSWSFLGWQTVIIIGCITLNLVALTKHWDPYPFILLNLVFSTQAAYAALLILLAQRRSDQAASEEAHHTLENTELLKKLLAQNTELTQQVHALVCVEGKQ
jgi:uncharacterized membrane protein